MDQAQLQNILDRDVQFKDYAAQVEEAQEYLGNFKVAQLSKKVDAHELVTSDDKDYFKDLAR